MEPPRVPEELAFYLLGPIALAVGIWQRRWALTVSALALAFLGLRANREAYDAHLVFAPLLAAGIARLPRPAIGAAACAALAFVTHRLDRDFRNLELGARWNEHLLPIRAARAIPEGPGFNGLRDGGWLAYAGIPPLVDGRIQAVPPDGWRELQEAELSRVAFEAYLERLGVRWALATRLRERIGGYRLLHASARWALVYWDDLSELYVRRDLPGAREEYRFFHPWGEIVGAVEKLPASDLPALVGEIDRFEKTTPRYPAALLVRCAALGRLHDPARAAVCSAALLSGASPALVARAERLR